MFQWDVNRTEHAALWAEFTAKGNIKSLMFQHINIRKLFEEITDFSILRARWIQTLFLCYNFWHYYTFGLIPFKYQLVKGIWITTVTYQAETECASSTTRQTVCSQADLASALSTKLENAMFLNCGIQHPHWRIHWRANLFFLLFACKTNNNCLESKPC